MSSIPRHAKFWPPGGVARVKVRGPGPPPGNAMTPAMGGMGRGVTSKSIFFPARNTATFTLRSGCSSRVRSTSVCAGLPYFVRSSPATETMTSPLRMPASAAGPPGLTATTWAPSFAGVLSICTPSCARMGAMADTPCTTMPGSMPRMKKRWSLMFVPSCADSSLTSRAAASSRFCASASLRSVCACSCALCTFRLRLRLRSLCRRRRCGRRRFARDQARGGQRCKQGDPALVKEVHVRYL